MRLNEEGGRVLNLAVWDYDKATLRKRPPFFNARSETFATGEAFAKRRCLVPVSGFYEWAVVNGRKQPFVFVREEIAKCFRWVAVGKSGMGLRAKQS